MKSHLLPVVRIKSGLIRGEVIENPVSESNKIYYSFQGIPYAQPPIGHLRFQVKYYRVTVITYHVFI